MLPRRTAQLLLATLTLAGTAAATPVLLSGTNAQAAPSPSPTVSAMALLSVELTLPAKAKAGSVVSAMAKVKTLDERPARNVLLRTGKLAIGTVSATCTQTLDGA